MLARPSSPCSPLCSPGAADTIRRRLLAAPYSGAVPELIALTSMARAITRRDVRLALALRATSPTAHRYLLVEHTSVTPAYPLEFTEHIRIAKANDELKGDAPATPSKARGGRLAADARMPH